MKKLLSITIMLLMTMTISAQVYSLTNGAYDNKVVGQYEGVEAGVLYVRALEALSDWAGSQSKSKVNIDVQDKEQGLVVFKGSLYVGFHKVNFMAGWNVYADFTLKIKCKDGRAQVSCHVPSATFDWTAKQYPANTTVPLGEIYPQYNHKSQYKIKKAAIEWAPKIPPLFDEIIKSMTEKMKAHNQDDDF